MELAAVEIVPTAPPGHSYCVPLAIVLEPVPSWIITMIPDCPIDSVVGLANVTFPVKVNTWFW